jgi:hypothetical protein
MERVSLCSALKMKLRLLLRPPDILHIKVAPDCSSNGDASHNAETGVVDRGGIALLRVRGVKGNKEDQKNKKKSKTIVWSDM